MIQRITTYSSIIPLPPPCPNDELAVIFVDKDAITDINQRYLGHKGPTDVITFNYLENDISSQCADSHVIGEIFVCLEIAADAAKQYEHNLSTEVMLYITHGLLHLSGLDDREDSDRKRMRQAERSIMSKLQEEFQISGFFQPI